MPDQQGTLSPEEKAAIAATLNAKVGSVSCPFCRATNWQIGPQVTSAVNLGAGSSIAMGGTLSPLVQLISPCGYVAFFAAKTVGLPI